MRIAIRKKLRSRRGETLTETLAAILIVGLVSGGLAAMISAATHMNQEAERLNDELLRSVYAAESKEIKAGGTEDNSVTVKRNDTITTGKLDVSYYGNGSIYAYDYEG